LVREAARIADRMGPPWYAVYVRTPRESPEKSGAATSRQIGNNLDLARRLGATSLAFKGADAASTLAAFAREYGITHVIASSSHRPWYRRWLHRSVTARLQRMMPGLDLTILDSKEEESENQVRSRNGS
jgi:two-component system sensor histidine kinase KdpD